MQFKKWLSESFEDWKSGRWIHYGNDPQMSINWETMWEDPAGIYFFPEKFRGAPRMFRKMPYKWTMVLKSGAKVLDLSNEQEVRRIAEKIGLEVPDKSDYDGRDITHIPYGERFFTAVRDATKRGDNPDSEGMWKFYRKLGYDALFDDTRYDNEPQLIVFNVKAMERVDSDERKRRRPEFWKRQQPWHKKLPFMRRTAERTPFTSE
jgi:hypothetical protein